MRKYFNPIRIIGCWGFIVFIFDLVVIPYAYCHTVGGEQKPIIYLMSSIRTAFVGVFILSFLTSILFFDWFKRYWFINCFFFCLPVYIFI